MPTKSKNKVWVSEDEDLGKLRTFVGEENVIDVRKIF